MRRAIRSLWAEPRAPGPPAMVGWDRVLVAALVLLAVVETVLRDDLLWRPFALVQGVALLLLLPWRRSRPLLVVAVVFGVLAAVDIASELAGADPELTVLWSTAWVLMLPYALLRWGSGREVVFGLGVLVAFPVVTAVSTGPWDALLGIMFFLSSAAVGAAARYAATSRLREVDQIKLREREQLARELHDTIAHHVSAIAIQAQAGRTLAAEYPDRAMQALEDIEAGASRTLAEMRGMVGFLRDAEEPALAPQPGVPDIRRLARDDGAPPRVEVELSGDLDDLGPAVGPALYRLAQESVTNAVRHARDATRVEVRVTVDGASVRLTVRDDGVTTTSGRAPEGHGLVGPGGYGLVGMAERAALLGGTFAAGPSPEGGWRVDAVLPRTGVTT